MSKYVTKAFMDSLQALLYEFRKYQADNNEAYRFDLLGLMDWLDAEKGIDTISPTDIILMPAAPHPNTHEDGGGS